MTITAQLSDHPVPEHMRVAAAWIVANREWERLSPDIYRVRDYTVTIRNGEWTCTCPSTIRCKHQLAALFVHVED